MSTIVQLPERPSLEQLKKRARELARDEGVKLTEAQLRIARMHGFASWPKLKAHVETITALTRTPDTTPPSSNPADEFLRLCCLCYSDADSPAKRAQASAMLTHELSTRNIWIAAATANVDAVRRFVEQDPSLANTEGGPARWEPLMYLAYARFEPVPTEEATLLTAATLLNAGADPNAGYLWYGMPSPFTVLTGVFGEGEQGPVNQSRHPHCTALARLLLQAGADPNDSQVLYNRQFEPGAEHLELLFEFGLGSGDGGPWKKKLTVAREEPQEMLRQQLRWAIHHDMRDRVRLLAEHNVDITTPFDDGRTPAQLAVVCGHKGIVEELEMHGAVAGDVDPVDEFIGAVLAGEKPVGDAAPARARRPSLVVQAARSGRGDAVRRTVELGWDVNALGRADIPTDEPWQTALHTAVEHNDTEMVSLLLELGADPSIEDARFHATPLGWAEHFGHTEIAALLPRAD